MTVSPEYQPEHHTHVLFEKKNGLEVGSFEGPCQIILHTKDRVWVAGSYYDFPMHEHVDAVQVGDGKNNGYSWDGCCVISVNVKHVTGYLTQQEAAPLLQQIALGDDPLGDWHGRNQ